MSEPQGSRLLVEFLPSVWGSGAGTAECVSPTQVLGLAGRGTLESLLVRPLCAWDENFLDKLSWGSKGPPCPHMVGRNLGSPQVHFVHDFPSPST